VPVTVNLVITDETLFAGGTDPARLVGHGPMPGAIARELIASTVADRRSRATLRRIYKHPRSGALVALESRARLFPKALATFIDLRDDTCRTPCCNAPIRHHDHVTPHHRNGPTSAANGQGDCERCNYVKEAPGWSVSASTDEFGSHTTEVVTPTGNRHQSAAPRLPGPCRIELSEIEYRVGVHLATRAA
jgi:hypothetical protein